MFDFSGLGQLFDLAVYLFSELQQIVFSGNIAHLFDGNGKQRILVSIFIAIPQKKIYSHCIMDMVECNSVRREEGLRQGLKAWINAGREAIFPRGSKRQLRPGTLFDIKYNYLSKFLFLINNFIPKMIIEFA